MGYSAGPAIRADGLGMAAGATLLGLGALWLAVPNVTAGLTKVPPIIIYADPLPPPPPPEPEQPRSERTAPKPSAPQSAPQQVEQTVPTPPNDSGPISFTDSTLPPPLSGDPGTLTLGEGGGGTLPLKPAPVIKGPEIDRRFANDFQPDYPAGEIRQGREGVVTVRVLVGVDGRVKAFESVAATSDDFLAATRRRAFAAWRFKPATRDGVAYEEWKQLRVTFTLKDE